MKFTSTFFALAAIVSSALATPIEIVQRNEYPPRDQVKIEGIRFAGSGCPGGSVQISLAEDLSNVMLLFTKYDAKVGPAITNPSDWQKNCMINFNIRFPSGFTYSIFETEYTGYVSLDKDVKAKQQSDYWFTGYGPKLTSKHEWKGIFDDRYTVKDTLGVTSLVYCPCGLKTTLNINSMISVNNRNNRQGSGLITAEATSLTIKEIYHLRWKRCH